MIEARISAVRLLELTDSEPGGEHRLPRQSRPASIYDDRHTGATGRPVPAHLTGASLYLEIDADNGVTGRYGPVDREAVAPLAERIAPALLGLDALAVGYVWDLLTRSDRHARHGWYKIAVSAVDNALWDLRGRILGAPVWQLLGGSGRRAIPAYASTLGTAHDEGEVERVAAALVEEGYTAQKWFFTDGPGQGPEGMERNVALVERVRHTVGHRSEIMFDAFMSWDLQYARRWCRQVEHLGPDWLEEPFAPDAVPAYAQLRTATSIPLATGEHLYDRADVLGLLERDVLGVLQVDPEWCGGVSELVRMCAIAEPYGVAVVPHGHGIHAALHVVAAQSPAVCPRVEYLYHHMPHRHRFEIDTPAPRDGRVPLPTRPGFGIELDQNRVGTATALVDVG